MGHLLSEELGSHFKNFFENILNQEEFCGPVNFCGSSRTGPVNVCESSRTSLNLFKAPDDSLRIDQGSSDI